MRPPSAEQARRLAFAWFDNQNEKNLIHSETMKSIILVLSLALTGCVPVALVGAGIGGGVAAQHHLGGYAYRTFSEPLPKVRIATFRALRRMSIPPGATEKIELGERINTKAGDRTIEIELEALTPGTTRVRTVAKKEGLLLVDASTAIEIITQIERSLETN
jgi:hypothetical protein